jgi:hypothetical protein
MHDDTGMTQSTGTTRAAVLSRLERLQALAARWSTPWWDDDQVRALLRQDRGSADVECPRYAALVEESGDHLVIVGETIDALRDEMAGRAEAEIPIMPVKLIDLDSGEERVASWQATVWFEGETPPPPRARAERAAPRASGAGDWPTASYARRVAAADDRCERASRGRLILRMMRVSWLVRQILPDATELIVTVDPRSSEVYLEAIRHARTVLWQRFDSDPDLPDGTSWDEIIERVEHDLTTGLDGYAPSYRGWRDLWKLDDEVTKPLNGYLVRLESERLVDTWLAEGVIPSDVRE